MRSLMLEFLYCTKRTPEFPNLRHKTTVLPRNDVLLCVVQIKDRGALVPDSLTSRLLFPGGDTLCGTRIGKFLEGSLYMPLSRDR